MAILETKFNQNHQVFFKYDGNVIPGVIISIEAHLGIWANNWSIWYNLQTGEDSGVDGIPEEHLFLTRQEAEADTKWESRKVKFFGRH